ncbi:MAG: molybdopterin-containing oxidoreductase family protein, partial [Coriobacteriales bacterium]
MATEVKEAVEDKVTSCRCHFCGSGMCNVLVHSTGDQVTGVEPDPSWPMSAAHCVRHKNNGRAALEYHYHPDRLNFPMKRVGERGENKWQRLSWDDALKEVGEKLNAIRDEYGAEAVGACTGTGRYGDYTWVKSKFLNLFGSGNNHGNEAICHGPATKAYEATVGWCMQIFMVPGVTKCLVLNSNQRESAPPAMAAIEAVKASGGKIISISPRFGNVSRIADYYLPVRPGSDGALYLAWMNVIINEDLYDHEFVENWSVGFDELKEYVQQWTPEKAAEICWVSADMIRETARVYATNGPQRLIGMQSYDGQAPNGFRTCRCCAMLECLVGAIDHGCPIIGPLDGNLFEDDYHAERNDMLPHSQQVKQIGGDRFNVIGWPGWTELGKGQQRRYGTQMYTHWSNQGHAPTLWRQILSEKPYPVKALILTGCGALTKYANTKLVLEAFKKLDLLVVADFFPKGLRTFSWTPQTAMPRSSRNSRIVFHPSAFLIFPSRYQARYS